MSITVLNLFCLLRAVFWFWICFYTVLEDSKRNSSYGSTARYIVNTVALGPGMSITSGNYLQTWPTRLNPLKQVLFCPQLHLGDVISISDAFWDTVLHEDIHFQAHLKQQAVFFKQDPLTPDSGRVPPTDSKSWFYFLHYIHQEP